MSTAKVEKARPRNLNLTTIRFPLPALVSILHRMSGVFLFLTLPFLLGILQCSLSSTGCFALLRDWAAQPIVTFLLFGIIWAFSYHLLAGVRIIALEMRSGINIKYARLSSKLVLVGSVILTILVFLGL